VITFGVVLNHTGKIKLQFDYRFFIVFLKKSYPYALLILLMSFYNRIDSVMLERMLPNGKEQAGIYAHAFRLLDAVSMFGLLFAGLLLPIFARMIKKKEDIGSMVQFAFALLFVPALVICFSLGFYDLEIVQLLNYSHPELSASILRLLMISFLGIATTYIFGTLLTANGSIRQLNQMALIGMGINIGLNLILIPNYQALGSAWSCMITQIFTAVVQIMIAVNILKLSINYRMIVKLTLFNAFILAAGFLSLQISIWWLGFLMMVTAGAIFAFAIRLINLKALWSIIQND
jgi:O-antigen/teichoic acid export membrane protein